MDWILNSKVMMVQENDGSFDDDNDNDNDNNDEDIANVCHDNARMIVLLLLVAIAKIGSLMLEMLMKVTISTTRFASSSSSSSC